MKNFLITLSVLAFINTTSQAQVVKAKASTISFFSKTPVEDISAKSSKASAAFDPAKKAIAFKIGIASFIFPSKLMQEHFNENYMETEKFPDATFAGAIQENVDLTKDGTYNVTVVGKMKIHGVEKAYSAKGTIAIKGKSVTINSKFIVALKDHNIEIPKLVIKNIAETIEVTVNATF
jgi:polyisoprenoid-binding protein YceI